MTELPSEGCFEAMEAVFSLSEAITGNNITINDLEGACRLAITEFNPAEGHDAILICLSMALTAVRNAQINLEEKDREIATRL